MKFIGLPDIDKPQAILADLRDIGLSELYSDNLSTKERTQTLKLYKKKLSVVNKSLKEEIRVVKATYDNRNRFEARAEEHALKPFMLIDGLLDQVEIDIAELEQCIELDRPIPASPIYDDHMAVQVIIRGEIRPVLAKEFREENILLLPVEGNPIQYVIGLVNNVTIEGVDEFNLAAEAKLQAALISYLQAEGKRVNQVMKETREALETAWLLPFLRNYSNEQYKLFQQELRTIKSLYDRVRQGHWSYNFISGNFGLSASQPLTPKPNLNQAKPKTKDSINCLVYVIFFIGSLCFLGYMLSLS